MKIITHTIEIKCIDNLQVYSYNIPFSLDHYYSSQDKCLS